MALTPWFSRGGVNQAEPELQPASPWLWCGRRCYLLGTLLMARSGRSTRTVRIADKLTLCPSREYSIMLWGKEERHQDMGCSVSGHEGAGAARGWGCHCLCALGAIAQACKTTRSVFAAHNVHHAGNGGYKGYFSL